MLSDNDMYMSILPINGLTSNKKLYNVLLLRLKLCMLNYRMQSKVRLTQTQLVTSLIFILGTIFLMPTQSIAGRTGSPLGIEILLEKNRFYSDETVSGEVIITNRRPGTYPVNFTVVLYRDGEFYRRSVVNTPVFAGRNKIPLEKFGMKDIFTGPHAVGRWRIEIDSGGEDAIHATALLEVLGEAKPDKPRRQGKYMYSTSPKRKPAVPRRRSEPAGRHRADREDRGRRSGRDPSRPPRVRTLLAARPSVRIRQRSGPGPPASAGPGRRAARLASVRRFAARTNAHRS